jgi:hypothetical protein
MGGRIVYESGSYSEPLCSATYKTNSLRGFHCAVAVHLPQPPPPAMQRSTFLPSSYSRPTNVTIGGPLHVRSDLPRPLQRPSLPSALPSLPSRPRPKNLINGYSLSTHIFPAAYARTSPHVPAPELPLEAGRNAETKRVSLKAASDEILNTRLAYEGGRLEAQEGNSRQLWCCVNRYVRQPQLRESRGQGLSKSQRVINRPKKNSWDDAQPCSSLMVLAILRRSVSSMIWYY